MKAAIAAGAFVFVALFVLTTFVPSPAAQAQAQAYFTPAEIRLGLEYSFQRKLLLWSSAAAYFLVFMPLVFAGGARELADRCMRWGGGHWLLSVLLMGAVCFLLQETAALPFRLAGLELQRAWGMTSRSLADWLVEYGKSLAVEAVLGTVLLLGLYALLRWLPRTWWVAAAAGSALVGVLYAFLLPVVISPLFNDFHPLQNPQLKEQVQALAERAGVPVQDVLVMDASRQGSHTNAYFTGFGSTRRIVLYDTLLKDHPPAEIESILAHEIGHWRHQHIVKGIALATVGAFLGFFVLARVLRWAVGRKPFWLTSPADPAGLPLILLLIAVGTWLALPLENAVSRHFERQADQTSLDLAGRPEVFIEAEKRLARTNKSNVAPAPLSVWFFASHPPVLERIRMAEEWRSGKGVGSGE